MSAGTLAEREIDLMYVWVPRVAIGTLKRHPATLAVYVTLLSRANWSRKPVLGSHGVVELDAGQCIFGRQELADECGTTERKARTAIEHLSKLGWITIDSSHAGTVATMVGYADLGRPRGS